MGEAMRWEFRCWLPQAADAAARLARDWPEAGREQRTDIYLLPPGAEAAGAEGGHLAKLRHGRILEAKRWLRSAPPLQCWEMALRADFPLPAAACRRLAEALGLPAAGLPDGTDPAALQAGLAAAGARIVAVAKDRRRYEREGCTAEATAVAIGGRRRCTVALEAAVPADARRALAALALAGAANIHYGRALQAILAEQEESP